MKISFPYLGTSNSKFKLNLTQWVTGSLVYIKCCMKLWDLVKNKHPIRYWVVYSTRILCTEVRNILAVSIECILG